VAEPFDLEAFLLRVTRDQQPGPRMYQLRVHPGLLAQITAGADPAVVSWPHAYGTAYLVSDQSLPWGGWQLIEQGRMVAHGEPGEDAAGRAGQRELPPAADLVALIERALADGDRDAGMGEMSGGCETTLRLGFADLMGAAGDEH
jgi:hypothetical protein